MEFFIDTADIKEIKIASEMGVLDGVTTNPSLVAKTGRAYKKVVQEICEFCPGPISAEVLATDFAGMMLEAREWAKLAPQIVVKIPLTKEGIKAVVQCSQEKIKTNVTLCFSPLQALVAAKAGADYISPFIGRLDDISVDGMELIEQLQKIKANYGFKTKILVASIRNPIHLKEAALIGADVATIPFKVMEQMIKHPLTDIGLDKFIKDGAKIPNE